MRQRLLPLLPTLPASSLASLVSGNLPVLVCLLWPLTLEPKARSSVADGTLRLALARNIVWLRVSAKKGIGKNRTCPRGERAAIPTPGWPWWRLGAGSFRPERRLFGLLSRARPEPVLLHWVPRPYSPPGAKWG